MQQQNNGRGQIGWFLSYYKPHMGLFLLDMFCACCVAGVDILFPITTRNILNEYIPKNMFTEFYIVIGVLLAAYVLRAFMMYIITFYGHMMGVRIEADMRRDLFSHVQTMSFSFFDKSRTGQIMSRILNDLFDVTELAHHGPEDLFISLITLVGAFIVLVQIQWKLTLAVFAVVPVLVYFTYRQRRRMHKASVKVREKMAGINSELESSISGARVAQAFANEGYEAEKFSHGNEQFKQAKNLSYKAMAIFHGGMEFFIALMPLIVVSLGGYFIMQDSMSLEDLLAFNIFVSTFVNPIKKLSNFVEQYTNGMAGFSRFAELMNAEPDIRNRDGAQPLLDVKGSIEFKDVSFSYDEGASVFRDVNLTVQPGMTLALVGPSGGGKTTLCHLIPRFYDVQSGRILVDGMDVRDIELQSLRQNIGIVQQDVFLFAGSIRDNIRYGRVDATESEIVEAAMRAKIHDAIMEMADGYDTHVGERGVLLSGGQKQRISIARIFLKNPAVLILDEATSALDTQTEALIQQSFDELSQGRTTIVIAHRLSTIKNADEIAVIGDEGILEKGSHDDLMKLEGEYYQLHMAQFGK